MPAPTPNGSAPLTNAAWPVRTSEHVDLWLHCYALLTADSMLVPYFAKGYREEVMALRRQRNVTSQMDANRTRLLTRINEQPSLATGPQFLPFYFASWDQMRQMVDIFTRANGNPRAAPARSTARPPAAATPSRGTSNKLTGFSQTLAGTTTSVAYGYNANGDLTSDGLRSYAYNAEGRLSDATTGATDTSPTTRYAHNALGQRVFKTEPLYPLAEGDESDPGFLQSLINFFTQLWAPSTTDAEKLGFAFVYDEEGGLIAQTGTGGANSTGVVQYVYLPTAAGPMPIAAVINGSRFAVHSDHLNTPRRLTDESANSVWQWAYSAFGDEQPTTTANRFAAPGAGTTGATPVTFNLRYPGQYYDQESGLSYREWAQLQLLPLIRPEDGQI